MQRQPPGTTFPDGRRDDDPPSFDESKLDGNRDRWHLVLSVQDGHIQLKAVKRGFDLYVSGDNDRPRVCKHFDGIMQTMRGFRVTEQNHTMPERFWPIESNDGKKRERYWICKLAIGVYQVESDADGWERLYWIDTIGTTATLSPHYAPEIEDRVLQHKASLAMAAELAQRRIPRKPFEEPPPPAMRIRRAWIEPKPKRARQPFDMMRAAGLRASFANRRQTECARDK